MQNERVPTHAIIPRDNPFFEVNCITSSHICHSLLMLRSPFLSGINLIAKCIFDYFNSFIA